MFVSRPRFSSFPQPNSARLSHEVSKRRRLSRGSPRPPHEVNKRHRLSGGSPPPSTRSQEKTQAMRHDIYRLRVSFSGGARPDGEAGRAEHTAGRTGGPVCRRWPVGRPSRWRTGGRPRTWAPAPSLRCLLAHRARTQKRLWAGANAPAHSRLVKTPVLTRTQLSSAQLKQPTEPHMRSTQRAALPSV